MKIMLWGAILTFTLMSVFAQAAEFEEDILKTSLGDLKMTFIGHGTLMFSLGDKIIHIDPVGRYADYAAMPQADLILVTHEHGDHLDIKVIELLKKPGTEIVLNESSQAKFQGGTVLKNGDVFNFGEIKIEAVPAYNLDPETSFHPKGRDNGYILNVGDQRIYIAGDTENIPEMRSLKDIDVAFLPMNRPYTMTPEMAAEAAKVFKPRFLYPYHYGNTDPQELVTLLRDVPEIEVRVRNLR
ncbi:MAG: MBL fold metallo-hydrolase [Candidatus Aminicenantaceae bacterium]